MNTSYIILLISLFSVYSIVKTETITSVNNATSARKIIKLNDNNFVSIKGEIDDRSASKIIADLIGLKEEKIYIYISSPGGSVIAGNHIIQTMEALTANGKKIVCIADIANSMAFGIFQSCPKRYVLEHSILMQHQMSINLKGSLENVKSMLEMILKINKKVDRVQSDKLGLSRSEFHELVQHDWWLYGDDIIANKAADEFVHVICDFRSDTDTYEVEYDFIFGKITLEFAKCPLVRSPLKITSQIDNNKVNNYVNTNYLGVNYF